MINPIRDDLQEEAERIIQAGADKGIVLRLLGGVAVKLHSPSATHRGLVRDYLDLDFATPARRAQPVETFFAGLGYEANKNFNLFNGDSRLLFFDNAHGRQIDIFIGSFEMCHRLPITDRLSLEAFTLPLAELLLTKLQIVQLNEKDVRDICALLMDHSVGSSDVETVNLERVVALCSEDWGLWKTVTLSLAKVSETMETFDLSSDGRAQIRSRIALIQTALTESPKPLRWRMRAAIGEKVVWYELPEEVRRG